MAVDVKQIGERVEKESLIIDRIRNLFLLKRGETGIRLNCPIRVSAGSLKKILSLYNKDN
jgi:hypothetical protein